MRFQRIHFTLISRSHRASRAVQHRAGVDRALVDEGGLGFDEFVHARLENAFQRAGVAIVLAPVRPSQGDIVFPKTTSSVWQVVFDYIQPLRISEMNFNDLSSGKVTTRGLRFLAQPKQSYQIYFDADRYVQSTSKEAGDLFSNNGVIYFKATSSIVNPEYVPVDSD